MSAIPARAVKTVKARDQACVRCGGQDTDTHHRQRRRTGGHGVQNMIRTCRACHSWIHAHPLMARSKGWIVPANGRIDPLNVPVLTYAPDVWPGRVYAWFLLDGDGGRSFVSETAARRMLYVAGVIEEEAN